MSASDIAYDFFLVIAIMAVGAASTAGFYTLVSFAQLRYSIWRGKK